MLLLAVDQKTRIACVGGDEIPAPIACRVKQVAGATCEFVIPVANDIRCAAAKPARDGADNAAFAVSDIFFIECHRFLLLCALLKSCLASSSRSVEILLERLLKDVLVCPPFGSSQRAKPDVCVVIDLERQGNRLVVAGIASGFCQRPAGWGLFLQSRDLEDHSTRIYVTAHPPVVPWLWLLRAIRIYVFTHYNIGSSEEPSR